MALGGVVLGVLEIVVTFGQRFSLALLTKAAYQYLAVVALFAVGTFTVLGWTIAEGDAVPKVARAFLIGVSFPALLRQALGYRASLVGYSEELTPPDDTDAGGAAGKLAVRVLRAFDIVSMTLYKSMVIDIGLRDQELAEELGKASSRGELLAWLERAIRATNGTEAQLQSVIESETANDAALLVIEFFKRRTAKKLIKKKKKRLSLADIAVPVAPDAATKATAASTGTVSPGMPGPLLGDELDAPRATLPVVVEVAPAMDPVVAQEQEEGGLGELGRKCVAALRKITEADYNLFLLHDAKRKALVCLADCIVPDLAAPPEAIPVAGVVGRALRTGATQRIHDVKEDNEYFPALAALRSQLAVPVKGAEGRIIGVFNSESTQLGHFSSRSAEAVEQLALEIGERCAWDPDEPVDLKRCSVKIPEA